MKKIEKINNFKWSEKGSHKILNEIKKLIFSKISKNNLNCFVRGGDIISSGPQVNGVHEPVLTNFIDFSCKNGFNDFFMDIGANIGVYSLLAALKLKKVMAFEPSAFNYYLLNKNIYLNGLDKKIDTFNIAFSNITSLDYLYLSSVESAGGVNSFAVKEDACGDAMNVAYRQSCFGLTIDDFISQYKLSTPNYIKIDVDGIELLIIKGGGGYIFGSISSICVN